MVFNFENNSGTRKKGGGIISRKRCTVARVILGGKDCSIINSSFTSDTQSLSCLLLSLFLTCSHYKCDFKNLWFVSEKWSLWVILPHKKSCVKNVFKMMAKLCESLTKLFPILLWTFRFCLILFLDVVWHTVCGSNLISDNSPLLTAV